MAALFLCFGFRYSDLQSNPSVKVLVKLSRCCLMQYGENLHFFFYAKVIYLLSWYNNYLLIETLILTRTATVSASLPRGISVQKICLSAKIQALGLLVKTFIRSGHSLSIMYQCIMYKPVSSISFNENLCHLPKKCRVGLTGSTDLTSVLLTVKAVAVSVEAATNTAVLADSMVMVVIFVAADCPGVDIGCIDLSSR